MSETSPEPELKNHPPEQAPTFKVASGNLFQLTRTSEAVRGLVGVLSAKQDNWGAQGTDPRAGMGQVDKGSVARVINWLARGDDFANLAQVEDFLRDELSRTVDTWAQKLAVSASGKPEGELSACYGAACRELIEVIQPFVNQEKKPPLETELDFWSRSTLPSGDAVVENRFELEARYRLRRVERGNLVFYGPDNLKEQHLARLEQLGRDLNLIIGDGEAPPKRIHIMLLPEAKFCPRGGAAALTGERLVVDFSHPDAFGVFVHEYAHAYLGQRYGPSASPIASEGAALIFALMRFPKNPRNNYEWLYGFSEVLDLARRKKPVGLSHTQQLRNAGVRVDKPQEFEFAYRFGGYLADYLITNYGREALLKFYERTCSGNLFDSQSGKQLIKNGVPVVPQHEIISQSLRVVTEDPGGIERQFDAFIKGRTANAAGWSGFN